jgi:hypothetical protein
VERAGQTLHGCSLLERKLVSQFCVNKVFEMQVLVFLGFLSFAFAIQGSDLHKDLANEW